MSNTKKGTLIGLLVGGVFGLAITVGAVALAHPGGPHGGRGHGWSPKRMEQHLTEMTAKMNLTAAQETEIRAALAEATTEAERVREMPRGSEQFEAFRDLHFETEDRIYATLSCEQREQLRLLKREHKADRMQQRWEDRPSRDSE